MRRVVGILNYCETRIQEPFYSWIMGIYNRVLQIRNPEKVLHLGPEYPDKTFYVIRLDNQGIGLASFFDEVLGAMKYAQKRGYIPVVDISDTNCSLVDPDRGGDAWEYYYEGIYTEGKLYTKQDARNAERVVYHNQNLITLYKRYSPKEIRCRSELCRRIRYNEETDVFLKQNESRILVKKPCIAVYYRGTDYKVHGSYVPIGHPKVMEIRDFWEEVQIYADKMGCSNIFFVTEEQEALDYVMEHQGKLQVDYFEKKRFSDFAFDDSISSKVLPGVSRYENNLLYLLDLDMMSKCEYLFGPFNSGIQMALNLNGGQYKDVHIVDIGRN